MIVRFIFVDMVDLLVPIGIWYESLCDKLVHRMVCRAVAVSETDFQVAMSVETWLHDSFWNWCWRSMLAFSHSL